MDGRVAGSSAGARSVFLSGASESFGLEAELPLEITPGVDLGGLTIVRQIGAGGMGTVYEARQAAPDRPVAVKLMRELIASPERRRRFEYEAEVLGRLRHPAIAQVFTCGTFSAGAFAVPFFVMELVPNARPITQYAREGRLDLAARVALVRRACEGVAHGHEKGVIHRDIKPGNVLVDEAGEVKVIDFGVAKSLAADPPRPTLATRAGELVGTLAYMSPEQFAGATADVDARSDVYALGLVLAEVVADRPAHLGRPAAEHRIADDAAAAVERAVRAAGGGRSAARSLAGVVATCLQPEPADRYATAVEVAAELARWSEGDPVLARPPTWGESLARLWRRRRAVVVAALVAAFALLAAAAVSTVFYLRAQRQAAAARAELYVANVSLAAEARAAGNLAEARRRLAAAQATAREHGPRQPLEVSCLEATLDDALAVVARSEASILATAWSPAGTQVAFGTRAGTVRVVAAPGRTEPAAAGWQRSGHEREVWRVAWSPDGRRLATASEDKTARVWDAESGRELARVADHAAKVYGVAFSPDGLTLATGGADGAVRLCDPASGAVRKTLAVPGGTVYDVVWLDADTLATAGQDGVVRLWDLPAAAPVRVFRGHTRRVFDIDVAPDGSRLATASEDGSVRLWRTADGGSLAVLEHPERVSAVAFTAAGRRLATAAGDAIVRVFAASRGRELRRLEGHEDGVMSVAAAPDGDRLVSGSRDCTLRLWGGADEEPRLAGLAAVRGLAYSPDGGTLAAALDDGTVAWFDARTLEPGRQLKLAAKPVRDIAYSDSLVAVAGDDGCVRLCDRRGLEPERSIHGPRVEVHSVAFARDGRRLATASDNNRATIHDLADPDAAPLVLRHPKRCFCARFSPDDRRLFTACEDGRVRRWEVASGRLEGEFAAHGRQVNWLAVSADGRLATASSDGTAAVWTAADGRLVHRLDGPTRQLRKVAFSPDQARVVAVSADGGVWLWETASGRPLPRLPAHAGEAWSLAFAPDGRTFATGGLDGTIHLHGRSAADVFQARAAVRPGRP